MKRYFYNYHTSVAFSSPVTRHFFKLRCVPRTLPHQQPVFNKLYIPGVKDLSFGTDWCGSGIQYGSRMDAHDKFVYISYGVVDVGSYLIPASEVSPLFLLPSALTKLSPEMSAITEGMSGGVKPLDKALQICEAVYRAMVYTPGVTSNETTASEAFSMRQGVCQDYAHIMVGLCRQAGLPARYVNGFLLGTGESHAWVEVYDGEAWRGVDPTNNLLIEYGYIKVSEGRDASDCPVNKGIFTGVADQKTEIKITVEEI